MRRSVGIVASRQSCNKLRTDLHQGLPRIGTCIARWCSDPIGPRDRNLASANVYIRIYIFHGPGVASSDDIPHFLSRGHGLALTHMPCDVFYVLHEAVEARAAERNLAAGAVENSCDKERLNASTESMPSSMVPFATKLMIRTGRFWPMR